MILAGPYKLMEVIEADKYGGIAYRLGQSRHVPGPTDQLDCISTRFGVSSQQNCGARILQEPYLRSLSTMLSRILVIRMSTPPKRKKDGRLRKPQSNDVAVAGRVPATTAGALDAYAKKFGITRSAAVRRLIEAGLKRWRMP
jgi:hypothetical protein